MEIRYTKYFEDFSCIASACPDSCCKEWSVDVDAASAAFYRELTGPLGNRLRQVLQDTDDGTIMEIENGRCPMWRQDGLCRIQAELGHDALCKVCQEFPRLRHDYGSFVELGLELSCPEAARLILSGERQDWVVSGSKETSNVEYDREIMEILLRSREEFLDFLDSTTLSFPEILAVALLYGYDLQAELDGGEKAVLTPENYLHELAGFSLEAPTHPLADFFLRLEILTPQWKSRLEAPAVQPNWDNGYRALLRYFLCRYWLQAISDYDLVCRIKFAVSACLLIGHLGGDFIQTAQLFSKEIENDPDNVEAILDGAYTAPELTDRNLLGYCRPK